MTTSQLTFTRFIAALLIVFYHFGGNLFHTGGEFIEIQRTHLYLGVNYFYVLSGFVMMIAYGNREVIDKKQYWINRIARIYPLHIFTLLLTIIVSLLVSINYLEYYKFNILSFIFNVLLLQSWIPEHSLSWNVPSWSVSVEMFFYFLFPFVYHLFFRKFNLKKAAIVIVLIWIIFQIGMNVYYLSSSYGGYDSLDRYFLYYNPLLHVATFFIGLLFGKYFRENHLRLTRNLDIPIILLFLFCTLLVYFLDGLFLHNGLLALPFAFLILFVACNNGKLTQLFNNKLLIHLGEISFAFYLLQNPVYIFLRKVFNVLGLKTDGYLLFFTGLICLLIVSHFTYKWVEIPMKNKIRNLKSREIISSP